MTYSQYSASPTPEHYKNKLDLQTKYDLLWSEKTEHILLKSQGFVYEHSEKASRLLAHQLKCKFSDQQLTQIQKENGALTTDPLEINNTFKAFYSKLYTLEAPSDDTDMQNFFTNSNSRVISPTHKAELELHSRLTDISNLILPQGPGSQWICN